MIAAVATAASYAIYRVICKSEAEIHALPLAPVVIPETGADDEVVRLGRGEGRSREDRRPRLGEICRLRIVLPAGGRRLVDAVDGVRRARGCGPAEVVARR